MPANPPAAQVNRPPLSHYEKIALRTAKHFRSHARGSRKSSSSDVLAEDSAEVGTSPRAQLGMMNSGMKLDLSAAQPRPDPRQPLSDRSTSDPAEYLLAPLPNPEQLPSLRIKEPPPPLSTLWPTPQRLRRDWPGPVPQHVPLPPALSGFFPAAKSAGTHPASRTASPASIRRKRYASPLQQAAKSPSSFIPRMVPAASKSPTKSVATPKSLGRVPIHLEPLDAAKEHERLQAIQERERASREKRRQYKSWLTENDLTLVSQMEGSKETEGFRVPVRDFLNVKRMVERLDTAQSGILTWPMLNGVRVGYTTITKQIFQKMDKDHTGQVDFTQILKGLNPYVSTRELLKQCKALGLPFESEEFHTAEPSDDSWRSKYTLEQQLEIEAIYRQFVQEDPSGVRLSQSTLRKFVTSVDMGDTLFSEVFALVDQDSDGWLSLAEFAEALEDQYIEQMKQEMVRVKYYFVKAPLPRV